MYQWLCSLFAHFLGSHSMLVGISVVFIDLCLHLHVFYLALSGAACRDLIPVAVCLTLCL